MSQIVKQRIVTPAAGKRLIARAIAEDERVTSVLKSGTLVVIAGTTNGYVAEEILSSIGQGDAFVRNRFFRGVTLPPTMETTESGRLPDESEFPGDVVIINGVWHQGRTIFDVVDELRKGDLIIKGANAVDLNTKQAAIYIGHPKAGTIGVSLQAVVGRRVRLLMPVGLEKRVSQDVNSIASLLNSTNCGGPRMLPVNGQVFTELEAIETLTGATATLVAGGGVCGAEGSVWLAIKGDKEQVENAVDLLSSIGAEPTFSID